MKKIVYFSLIILCLISASTISWTPKPLAIDEGAITYKVDMESDEIPAMVQFMLNGSQLVIRFKDEFVRTEFDMSIASTTTIIDGKKQEGLMLMSVMGSKTAIRMGEEDLEQQNSQTAEAEITYFDETKEIAGYTCKKATVSVQDEGELTLFYTEEIQPKNMKTQYTVEGLKGFPLQLQIDVPGAGMKITMVAQEVLAEKQEASLFSVKIPEGYDERTMEEFQKMQGK